MTHRIKATPIWTPWGIIWRAYSDTLGADASPYGDGKTETEAREDLARRIQELDE